jgi:hypothetical protein
LARKKNSSGREVPFGWAVLGKYSSHFGPFTPSHHPEKNILAQTPRKEKQAMGTTKSQFQVILTSRPGCLELPNSSNRPQKSPRPDFSDTGGIGPSRPS